jgi:hypothetical protein
VYKSWKRPIVSCIISVKKGAGEPNCEENYAETDIKNVKLIKKEKTE